MRPDSLGDQATSISWATAQGQRNHAGAAELKTDVAELEKIAIAAQPANR